MLTRLINRNAVLSTAAASHRNFARYYNKAQATAQGMKDDMLSYEYKVNTINSIIPGPRFPTPALNRDHDISRDNKYSLERRRTNKLVQRQNEFKYNQGRMYTHLKLNQIKQGVIDVRKQSVLQDKKVKAQKAQFQKMPVDDQLNLAIGTEFDYIIKAKSEQNDDEKNINNIKMDELIEKLGYMDYRDALACNKYIIEAKRSGDYHQVARARTLEIAFARLGDERMTAIQNAARVSAKASGKDYKQVELQQIMDEDSELAEIYKDTFQQEKLDREYDWQVVKDVHDRFDKIRDQRRVHNKIKDKRFDGNNPYDTADEAWTTEFEDSDIG